jgi:glycosyltransferase involved in cell wall biosynthesis
MHSFPPILSLIISNTLVLFKLLYIMMRRKERISLLILFSLMPILSIYILKKFKLIKHIVYDDADFMPIFSKRTLSRAFISFLEVLAMKTADVVVSASEILKRLRLNIARGKIIVISNGLDEFFCNLQQDRDRTIDIIYVGGIDDDYIYLTNTLEALTNFIERHPNVVILFVGSGKNITKLHYYADKFKQIKYLGRVDRKNVALILSKAKIGIAPYIISGHARYGDPMKIKEYLVTTLCILTTDIPVIELFLKKVNACYEIVKDPSPQTLSNALEELYAKIMKNENEIICRHLSLMSDLCKEYNWVTLSKQYIMDALKSLR